MSELHLTRDRVYAFIVAYKQAHDGNSPTYRQILKACNISSTSVVEYHIRHLIADNRLRKVNRSFEIIGAHWLAPELCECT